MKTKLTLTTTFIFLSIIIHQVSNSPLVEGCPKGGVFGGGAYAQNIGINGSGAFAHPSALLDVDAASSPSLGILIPRIALQAINVASPITAPATSLLVYNTASASTGTNAVSAGYYYWDGAKWVRFAYTPSGSSSDAWTLFGNGGTNPTTNFLGTIDAQDLVFRTNNLEAVRVTTAGNVGMGNIIPRVLVSSSRAVTINGIGTSGPDIEFVGNNVPNSSIPHGRLQFVNNISGTPTLVSMLGSYGNTSGQDVGNLRFYTKKNGQLLSEKMVIQDDGNVGIGTTNPLYKLHVFNGSVKVDGTSNTGSNGALMMFGLNNSTDIGYVGDGSTTDNNMYLYSYNNDVRIGTGASSSASNSIYLDQLGNTGIGTVPANASAKLDVVSTTAGFAMPRMTSAQRKAIVAPIAGLQVYDINLKGYYTYDGAKWDCVTTPAGTVDYFGNITAPNGYLECNGQAVNRTTYAELFAAIGTLYGAGDGTTTFNVPDLRGEFIRGVDNGRGVDASRAIGSWQKGTLMGGDFDGISAQTAGSVHSINPSSGTSHVGADLLINPSDYPAAGLTAGIGGSNFVPSSTLYFGVTRPRNIALMACIKF